MKSHLWLKLLLLVGLIGISSCSVLAPPERRPLPTPLPTLGAAASLPNKGSESLRIANPGNFDTQLDADIIALMNAVSEQQLIAYVQTMQEFYTRNSFSDTTSDTRGIGAARRWLLSEFERVGNGRLRVGFEDFVLNFNGLTANQRNVVATLPGVGSHAGVIVIGAHYDSRLVSPTDGTSFSPSADDNASGIAMLLELARLLSSRQWNQTIVFVAFAAEEQETGGSRNFVNQSFLNGRVIDQAISVDTVGGRQGIPQSVRIFAPEMEISPHGQVARYIDFMTQLYLPEFPIELNNALDREGRYGDQREFVNVGIPSVRMTESVEDPLLLNSPTDTWDRLDYSYLAKVTKVNLVTIANWAGAPPPPAPPAISKMAEPGTFLLSWTVDPQASGYAIAFRPITSVRMPLLRTVSNAEAGNVVLSDFDPQETYAVSIAPISFTGRLGGFSRELIVGP